MEIKTGIKMGQFSSPRQYNETIYKMFKFTNCMHSDILEVYVRKYFQDIVIDKNTTKQHIRNDIKQIISSVLTTL